VSYPIANANDLLALQLNAETGITSVLHVNPAIGSDALYQGKTSSAPKATIAAAVAALAGGVGKIILSEGTHDVGNGLSLSGAKCSIIGQGAGATGGDERTAIYASTQSGPVVDWTGFLWPNNFQGHIEFGGFSIVGSGIADATKNNAGMRAAKTVAAGSAYFHDISIRDTGGPCADLGYMYLCDFERIVLNTPVSAYANDVPYLLIEGGNDSKYDRIGFRSILSSADTGPSGALIVRTPNATTNTPAGNLFDNVWFEGLHIPNGGCLVSVAGNDNQFRDPAFTDTFKEVGASNTAYFRFSPPPSGDYGDNVVSGYIPGRSGTNSVDFGVDLQQSNNLIQGIKGANGYNVNVGAAVTYASINLIGAEGGSTNPAVVNNSTQPGIHIVDWYNGIETIGGVYTKDAINQGGGRMGPRFVVPGTPATGYLYLGNAGIGIEAINNPGQFQLRQDQLLWTSIDGTKSFKVDCASSPGITFPDSVTLQLANYLIQGKVSMIRGSSGVADQLWVGLKDATDAYNWQQLTKAKVGTAVLVAGAVTVSDAKITANSVIRLSSKTLGGTPGALFISAKVAATSFTITSTNAADTSTVYYEIVTY
jgi:hypothetical protein